MTRDQKRRTAWIAQVNRWKVSLTLRDGSVIENTQVTAVDTDQIVCTRGGRGVALDSVLLIEVHSAQQALIA